MQRSPAHDAAAGVVFGEPVEKICQAQVRGGIELERGRQRVDVLVGGRYRAAYLADGAGEIGRGQGGLAEEVLPLVEIGVDGGQLVAAEMGDLEGPWRFPKTDWLFRIKVYDVASRVS